MTITLFAQATVMYENWESGFGSDWDTYQENASTIAGSIQTLNPAESNQYARYIGTNEICCGAFKNSAFNATNYYQFHFFARSTNTATVTTIQVTLENPSNGDSYNAPFHDADLINIQLTTNWQEYVYDLNNMVINPDYKNQSLVFDPEHILSIGMQPANQNTRFSFDIDAMWFVETPTNIPPYIKNVSPVNGTVLNSGLVLSYTLIDRSGSDVAGSQIQVNGGAWYPSGSGYGTLHNVSAIIYTSDLHSGENKIAIRAWDGTYTNCITNTYQFTNSIPRVGFETWDTYSSWADAVSGNSWDTYQEASAVINPTITNGIGAVPGSTNYAVVTGSRANPDADHCGIFSSQNNANWSQYKKVTFWARKVGAGACPIRAVLENSKPAGASPDHRPTFIDNRIDPINLTTEWVQYEMLLDGLVLNDDYKNELGYNLDFNSADIQAIGFDPIGSGSYHYEIDDIQLIGYSLNEVPIIDTVSPADKTSQVGRFTVRWRVTDENGLSGLYNTYYRIGNTTGKWYNIDGSTNILNNGWLTNHTHSFVSPLFPNGDPYFYEFTVDVTNFLSNAVYVRDYSNTLPITIMAVDNRGGTATVTRTYSLRAVPNDIAPEKGTIKVRSYNGRYVSGKNETCVIVISAANHKNTIPATMKVYSIFGELVYTKEYYIPADNSLYVEYDYKNNDGELINPGVYIVRIHVGDKVYTEKIIR